MARVVTDSGVARNVGSGSPPSLFLFLSFSFPFQLSLFPPTVIFVTLPSAPIPFSLSSLFPLLFLAFLFLPPFPLSLTLLPLFLSYRPLKVGSPKYQLKDLRSAVSFLTAEFWTEPQSKSNMVHYSLKI